MAPSNADAPDVGAEVRRHVDEVEARRYVGRRADRRAEVQVRVEVALEVVRLDAIVVLVSERRVVAQLIHSADDRRRVVALEAGLEDRRAAVGHRLHAVPRNDVAGLVLVVVGRHAVLGVAEVHRTSRDRRAEFRSSRRALLRDDLDHAVGRFRSVDRRGGGTLDDLDALDVGRVDVVHPALDRVALRAETARDAGRSQVGRVVDANAVDVDQRIVRETNAARSADLNRSVRCRDGR